MYPPYQYEFPIYTPPHPARGASPSFIYHPHRSHHSVSSSNTETLYTPSTGYSPNYFHPGTISPEALQWAQNERERRARDNTIPGSLLAGDQPHPGLSHRRESSQSGGLDDDHWDRSIVSPSLSGQESAEGEPEGPQRDSGYLHYRLRSKADTTGNSIRSKLC